MFYNEFILSFRPSHDHGPSSVYNIYLTP